MGTNRTIDLSDLYQMNVNWFVENYWNEVRWQINDGFIEEGRLDWKDVTSIMTVLSVMAESWGFNIPDDIIGEFEKRGYGETIEKYKKERRNEAGKRLDEEEA